MDYNFAIHNSAKFAEYTHPVIPESNLTHLYVKIDNQDEQIPIGWCSVAPRKTYGRLERSRSLQRIDEKDAWSVTCFFITPTHQQKNLSLKLLKEAINYASSQDAEVIEGYPVEPKEDGKRNFNVSYRFMGYVSTFEKAGFKDVIPKDSKRKIMRYICNV